MGLPIFETMDRLFPGKVEGITFTQQTKEAMATKAKRHLEETRCRLPNDQAIWQSFRSVRKSSTALGQVRFDAAREYDHADFWWAFCLAEEAAGQPTVPQAIIVPGIIDTGQIVGDFNNSTGGHGFLDIGGSFSLIDGQTIIIFTVPVIRGVPLSKHEIAFWICPAPFISWVNVDREGSSRWFR